MSNYLGRIRIYESKNHNLFFSWSLSDYLLLFHSSLSLSLSLYLKISHFQKQSRSSYHLDKDKISAEEKQKLKQKYIPNKVVQMLLYKWYPKWQKKALL